MIKEIHKVDVIREKEEEKEKNGSLENSSPVPGTPMNDPNESEMDVAHDPVL